MALLKASLNPEADLALGGGDITVVDGNSLISETGPLGTVADMTDENHTDRISIYVVKEGDSLSQIAKMFGVNTSTIIWANDIKRGDLIQEGQSLIILPINGVKHTVKEGDTIASIAKKYKADIEEIYSFNDLSSDSKISLGQEIVVPDGEGTAITYSSKSVASVVKGSGAPAYVGYYIKPVNGVKSQGLHGYNAVDIAAPTGTPIVASASGYVTVARDYGWNGGYGSYIVISHDNGTQTLYAHANSVIVAQGYRVVQGQVIGYVGSTGKSTGPHIHFEIRGAKNPF